MLQQIASAVAAGSAEAALAALRAENARLQQERDDIRSIQEERAHIEHERFLLVRTLCVGESVYERVSGSVWVCVLSVCMCGSVCVSCLCVRLSPHRPTHWGAGAPAHGGAEGARGAEEASGARSGGKRQAVRAALALLPPIPSRHRPTPHTHKHTHSPRSRHLSLRRQREQDDLKKQLENERLDKLRILREQHELKRQMALDKRAQLAAEEKQMAVRREQTPYTTHQTPATRHQAPDIET